MIVDRLRFGGCRLWIYVVLDSGQDKQAAFDLVGGRRELRSGDFGHAPQGKAYPVGGPAGLRFVRELREHFPGGEMLPGRFGPSCFTPRKAASASTATRGPVGGRPTNG